MLSETKGAYTHFEHMDGSGGIGEMTVNMFIIYRPPPARQDGFKNSHSSLNSQHIYMNS